MDPAVLLLPEITLNEGRAFDHMPSSQRSSADRSPSQEGRDTRRLSGPSLQTSPEISNRQLCPAEPHLVIVMGESAAQGDSRASGMTWQTANSPQRCSNQQPAHQHLIPVGPRAPDRPFPCWPQPVRTPLIPQLICQPCSPLWSNRMTLSPVASTSNSGFGFTPRVLAPSRCAPPRLPWVYLHLLHPSGCLRLQSVPLPQLCSPDWVLISAAQQVDEQLRATATSEQNEEQAESEEGQQENDDETTESNVSPGSLPSLDEESLAERAFEEYMAIMDSLGLQIPEGEETGESEEDEKKRKVAYLEKLCSDEGFIRGQQDSYPPSADSKAATEETSPARSPIGTQSDTSPNHGGQNSPTSMKDIESKDGWTSSSPIRLEEPLHTDATTGHVDMVNTLELINSSLEQLANISPDTSSTSDARHSDSPVEEPAAIFPSEAASEESSNVADTQTSRTLQEGDPPSLEFSSTSSVSGSNMDPCAIAAKDSAPSFRADSELTVNLSGQIRKPVECSPKNTNLTPSCLDQHAREERRTFDGRLTEIEKTELQQELKVDRDLSSHTGVGNALKEKDLGELTEQREEVGPPKSGYVTSKTPKEKVLVSSQVPKKENISGESPRVKTDFQSTQESVKDDQSRQDSPKGQTDEEIDELSSVKSCEKTPHLTPAFSPETQKRHKTVAGTTTLDFYSLRSGTHKLKVSKGKAVNKTVEDPPSSPDHTAGMQGQSVTSSPMKRYRQDRESSEERKTRLNETETISPMKRRRWRKKDEAQVETPGRKPTPPLRRSYRKSLGLSAGQETVVTRASREGTNKRQKRLSKKLPTKYKDFILYTWKKQKGKVGRGRTARRCVSVCI